MIHTKYNFKKYLRTKYPDIKAEAVYGIPAYILDKPLSPQDMFDYGVSQFNDGKYIVFVGIDPKKALSLMKDLIENGIPKTDRGREYSTTVPTTYASFQDYLFRSGKQFKHRTFIGNNKPSSLLLVQDAYVLDDETRSWFMYEFDSTAFEERQVVNVPHAIVPNNDGTHSIVLLIKAPQSSYKSKRQLRIENFNLMQPLYEQIVVACNEEDWDKALHLCESYKSITFQKPQHCKIDDIKQYNGMNMILQYLSIEEETAEGEEDF